MVRFGKNIERLHELAHLAVQVSPAYRNPREQHVSARAIVRRCILKRCLHQRFALAVLVLQPRNHRFIKQRVRMLLAAGPSLFESAIEAQPRRRVIVCVSVSHAQQNVALDRGFSLFGFQSGERLNHLEKALLAKVDPRGQQHGADWIVAELAQKAAAFGIVRS